MRTLTFLGAVSLGAGVMYLLDPDRGARRRAELRETLNDLGDSELVERAVQTARRMEPAVRQIGGEMLERPTDWWSTLRTSQAPALLRRATRRRGPLDWARYGRSRRASLEGRDWALLGGLIGATVVGIWLGRRAMRAGGDEIEVERSITIDAPVDRVYGFWNDFENFPRFMSHVREVRPLGGDRTHWVVAGPAGAPVEWDAIVTQRIPNEVIAWRTVDGALVEHSGTVRFRPAGANSTRVEVRMRYRPVGGTLGHGLASLFGTDPESVMSEDLARMAAQLRGQRSAVGETGSWR